MFLYQCTTCFRIKGCGENRLESQCKLCVVLKTGSCKKFNDPKVDVRYITCGECKFNLFTEIQ